MTEPISNHRPRQSRSGSAATVNTRAVAAPASHLLLAGIRGDRFIPRHG
ncbi:hypothetical protein ABZ027_09355 [Streptomyces sp. NPDC006332]